jgi:hypothetical protein
MIGWPPIERHLSRVPPHWAADTLQPLAEHDRAGLSTAIEMYRNMKMTFWLSETEAALVAVEDR